jgi:hypothetical protein
VRDKVPPLVKYKAPPLLPAEFRLKIVSSIVIVTVVEEAAQPSK